MFSEAEPQIHVVGICGSLRPESYTRMALQLALAGAKALGAETELIDLRQYQLAFCGELDEADYPHDVVKLSKKVKHAQGVILGTPEYHGSFSGVLKNAIDLMGFDEFGGKIIGLVGVSGGQMGAINALSGLRTIGRQLHAWVIPEQVSIPEASTAFNTNGKLNDEEVQSRTMEIGRQVARFAYLHSSEKVQEFLRLWETAPHNPGGEVSHE